MAEKLLEIKNFNLQYDERKLIENQDLSICKGDRIAIKGLSGSGKSSLAQFIIKALAPSKTRKISGSCKYYYQNEWVDSSSNIYQKKILGNEIAYVWQEPKLAFNPVFRCSYQVIETMQLHRSISKKQAIDELKLLLEQVGLHSFDKFYDAYPHQLSGGELQRYMLVLALCNKPKLLIADEPTTSLDSLNAKLILDLILEACKNLNTSLLFISHDAKVLKYTCNIFYEIKDKRIVQVSNYADAKVLVKDVAREHDANKVLKISRLVHYYGRNKILDIDSFYINDKSLIGLVGGSGSGKSTLAKYLCGLYTLPTITKPKNVQLIFQTPGTALNPLQRVGVGIKEVIKTHSSLAKAERKKKTIEMLERAGLSADDYNKYPNELSGGEKQRICLIKALATKPDILIGDEFLASVDVDLQIDLLNWVLKEQKQLGFAFVFISHNLELLRLSTDYIWVMHNGSFVEQLTTKDFFIKAEHQYSKMLLANTL